MLNKTLYTSLLLLLTTPLFGQKKVEKEKTAYDYSHMTSDTKYVGDIAFTKKVFVAELNLYQEVLEENSPYAMFLSLGGDYKWLTKNSIYFSVGPRAKLGWLSGNNDSSNDDAFISYNTFGWGLSAVPTIGIEVDESSHSVLFLRGEIGWMNYHTSADFHAPYFANQNPRPKKNYNDYNNLLLGIRAGIQANTSEKFGLGVWVGLSNINTKQYLKGMHFNDSNIDKRALNGEIGIGVFF